MKIFFTFLLLTLVSISLAFSQVKKIYFEGSRDTVIVSGCLYGEDVSPSQDDPFTGVTIWWVGDNEDGSSCEVANLKGTTYYKTNPDTLIFTPNTTTGDTLYAFVIMPWRISTVTGKYTIKVNGKVDSITAANVLYLFDHINGVAHQNIGQFAKSFRLQQNFPNPFNPSTTIQYEIPTQADVQIAVYDVSGRLIRTLLPGQQNSGVHNAIWDGKDQNGSLVSSGSYYYQVKVGEDVQTKRAMLIK